MALKISENNNEFHRISPQEEFGKELNHKMRAKINHFLSKRNKLKDLLNSAKPNAKILSKIEDDISHHADISNEVDKSEITYQQIGELYICSNDEAMSIPASNDSVIDENSVLDFSLHSKNYAKILKNLK